MGELQEQAMPSDCSVWGEKDGRGAYNRPLNVAGELVDVEKDLPPFSEVDKLPSPERDGGRG